MESYATILCQLKSTNLATYDNFINQYKQIIVVNFVQLTYNLSVDYPLCVGADVWDLC